MYFKVHIYLQIWMFITHAFIRLTRSSKRMFGCFGTLSRLKMVHLLISSFQMINMTGEWKHAVNNKYWPCSTSCLNWERLTCYQMLQKKLFPSWNYSVYFSKVNVSFFRIVTYQISLFFTKNASFSAFFYWIYSHFRTTTSTPSNRLTLNKSTDLRACSNGNSFSS